MILCGSDKNIPHQTNAIREILGVNLLLDPLLVAIVIRCALDLDDNNTSCIAQNNKYRTSTSSSSTTERR